MKGVSVWFEGGNVGSADSVSLGQERKAVDLGGHIGFSQNLLTAGWLTY
jgi:hypothetical protein